MVSKGTAVALVVGAATIIGAGAVLASKARSSGPLSLSVSPMSGNILTSFDFSGSLQDTTAKPISGGQIVLYYVGAPYTDVVGLGKTAADGSYDISVGGFAAGSYSVYAAYVTGYVMSGGASSPVIAAKSGPVKFTVTSAGISCAPGTHSLIGPEPDGSYYVVAIQGGVSGGKLPYDFVFTWSDRVVDDTGPIGTDSRKFPGVPSAHPVMFTVKSADGQTCQAAVT